MKNLSTLLIILLITSICQAQISEVKKINNTAQIYDDEGRYSGYTIYLSSNSQLCGYNCNYVVISDNTSAKIYDFRGRYTGYQIYLNSSTKVKYVSCNYILIESGKSVKYYDFQGRYTGRTTY